MSAFTPQEFVRRWENTPLRERQSYQIHFSEVCDMLGHERPGASGTDSRGNTFVFDYGLKKDSGKQGFADVFYEGHFGIEYKGPDKHYKDLKDAYQQLLQYREKLNNPPLLVVCDIQNWEIHTNWPNTEKRVYAFTNADIANRPSIQKLLHDLFEDPARLHPDRNAAQVTTDAAEVFHLIAEDMRRENANENPDPLTPSPLRKEGELTMAERTAHFLTKLVFCLFAEDVSLLPAGPGGNKGIFAEIVEQTYREPMRFTRYAQDLFQAMADGGEVLFQKIPYFNGSLFDDVKVEPVSPEALGQLSRAAALNWESVEPAIFGTLFERSLDPSKRAQLGAHYTSRADILLIVEPVLMQPLRREWEAIKAEAVPIRAKLDGAQTPRERTQYIASLQGLREKMLKRLREIKVLDPACGSGNFLYVSLQLLMDLEKEVINHDLFAGLTLAIPEVHPRQMYGIELSPIAHDLASIVVWIGYIQWRQNNGYATLTHREPILEALKDNIRQMDAVMNADGTEPGWPEVDVIVGNPPFLGGYLQRGELGDKYLDTLFKLYKGRVPNGADLVCYWWEKARAQVESGKVRRAGLLATNSIRGGVNREVLDRIKETGDIFMAWSDRPWTVNGAAVRVSMVGFDNGEEAIHVFDGLIVGDIHPDLTVNVDATTAKSLVENTNMVARGIETGGPFELTDADAMSLMRDTKNITILVPIINGNDVTDRPRKIRIIDFAQTPDVAPESYSEIYSLLKQRWELEINDTSRRRRPKLRDRWWEFRRSGEKLRKIISQRNRYISTPRVAKHRLFVWTEYPTIPDSALFVFARDDDYFFGVLHSRLHEVWSLRMGTWLGVGNDPRYTPTTTFKTFPFPWPPGQEDVNSQVYQGIAKAAKQLHEERDAWLHPSGLGEKALKERTLTNLYNARNVWLGIEKIKTTDAAGDFAPRLIELHDALDKAVCAAYGWPESILQDEEEILRRLLELNLQRAGDSGVPVAPPDEDDIEDEADEDGDG